MLHDNLSVNKNNHLAFAGVDTVELAKKYGTPLMLIDEDRICERAKTYVNAVNKYFKSGGKALYASKALSFKGIYKTVENAGMCVDVVSTGEMYTALKAGVDGSKMYFHGNNKTDADIRFAIENNIGHFVADSREELIAINEIAKEFNKKQKILLRVTPGIDPHTNEKIATGKVDSKFGTPIETGQAEELLRFVLSLENIELAGLHCHVGSQVFDEVCFCDSADIMLKFMADMQEKYGYETKVLNLGGGFGVRYVESDPYIDIDATIRLTAEHIEKKCEELKINYPQILLEPGRSIVADSGITLYTVGSVKTINGYKSYVSVDGGMSDNPRFTLYGAEYTVVNASKAGDKPDFDCTLAGCCCESGDVIADKVTLANPKRDDILSVFVTGAYNYSMASNYNRIKRPPIVAVSGGKDRLVVRRETFEDLISCDL